jgi:hypothetical protein
MEGPSQADKEAKVMQEGIPLDVFVEFKIDMKDADFWLIRSHSEDKVGLAVRHYNPDYIGVRVRPGAKKIILPDYLYYLFQYLHQLLLFPPKVPEKAVY